MHCCKNWPLNTLDCVTVVDVAKYLLLHFLPELLLKGFVFWFPLVYFRVEFLLFSSSCIIKMIYHTIVPLTIFLLTTIVRCQVAKKDYRISKPLNREGITRCA